MGKIGHVLLDETYYPGEDLYSDGAIEERILKLAQEYRECDYNKVIARERDWAVMYHLSHERGNILSWYPFGEGAKVLEVGSGCGAITSTIAKKAGSVACIDLSKRRSTINALRNQERDNIKICIGNFQDVEKGLEKDFDYATLIGVFEYGKGYIGGEKPYHAFLAAVMEHLKPGGKLLLAIENKFGLKYWAGCTEDHVGRMFEGIEGYPGAGGVRTFSKPELIRIIEECGFFSYRFYYPYPDYKLPTVIYSDRYLPKKGELAGIPCNFDRPRLVLMDEGRVFGQILEDGLFGLYANSFFVEITKEPEEGAAAPGGSKAAGHVPKKAGDPASGEECVLYAKYSNGRAPEFALQTRIAAKGEEEPESLQIYKVAEYEEGKRHIRHIAQAAERLQGLWEEKGIFRANKCWMEGDRIFFEYLQGVTLEETLDRLLEQGELKQVMDRIQEAVGWILHGAPVREFQPTQEFHQVFGEVSLPEGVLAAEAADIDMIFSNLLLDGEGKCHVLDYEWSFFFPVPVEFIVYRALHYYLESASKRSVLGEYVKEYAKLYPQAGSGREANGAEGAARPAGLGKNNFREFYGYFGISQEMQRIYRAMEQSFQKYKSGGYVSLGDLYRAMGKAALPLEEIMRDAGRRRVQVYLDTGQGFSEENSYFIDQGFQDQVRCRATFPKGTKGVWIDPALSACILRDVRLQWKDGTPVPYRTNGIEVEKGCFLFDNPDPKIIIEEIPQGRRQIEASYKISILEEGTAAMLMDRMYAKGRVKDRIRKLIKG